MGTKIKKILEKRNMTQTDLFNAIKSNCNHYLGKDVISKIVNGKDPANGLAEREKYYKRCIEII